MSRSRTGVSGSGGVYRPDRQDWTRSTRGCVPKSTEVDKRAMNGRPEKRGAAVRRYTYVYCECSFLSVSKLLLLVSFDLSLPASSNPRKGPEPAPLVRVLSPIFVTS